MKLLMVLEPGTVGLVPVLGWVRYGGSNHFHGVVYHPSWIPLYDGESQTK